MTRPVLPRPLRPLALVVAALAAVALAVLGALVHASSTPDGPDRVIRAALAAQWPAPGPTFYAVDGLVEPVPVLVEVGVLALAALLTGQRRLAVVALLGPFGVAAAITVLKPVVGRTIHGANLSFPSGHTGFATAVGLVLGLLLVGLARPVRTGSAAVLLLGPALVVGTGMAFDQVVIDAHYPSDTLGGICIAAVVVLLVARAVDALADRRRPAGAPGGDVSARS